MRGPATDSQPPTMSVIVPTWKRPEALRQCLDALDGQSRPADEIVLVVRADDLETRAALRDRGPGRVPLTVVAPDGPGMTAAINTGLGRASGDLVCLTDDDAAPRPAWLERIDARFREQPSVGGVGGRDWIWHAGRPEEGAERVVGRVECFGRVVGNHHLGVGSARPVDILKGVNMSFRRRALGDLLMDPAMLGEATEQHCDLDLSMSVKAKGWVLLYDPSIEVDHYEATRQVGQRETGMSLRQLRDASHNLNYALMKSLPPARAAVAVFYSLLVGTRKAPGIVLAVEGATRRREPRESVRRWAAATDGRLRAFRSFLRWRRRL